MFGHLLGVLFQALQASPETCSKQNNTWPELFLPEKVRFTDLQQFTGFCWSCRSPSAQLYFLLENLFDASKVRMLERNSVITMVTHSYHASGLTQVWHPSIDSIPSFTGILLE